MVTKDLDTGFNRVFFSVREVGGKNEGYRFSQVHLITGVCRVHAPQTVLLIRALLALFLDSELLLLVIVVLQVLLFTGGFGSDDWVTFIFRSGSGLETRFSGGFY